MRRRVRLGIGAAALALAGMALGGCGLPRGVDGDLTNGWAAFPAGQVRVPAAGDCYDNLYDTAAVDCAQSHVLEAVYVGTFTGTPAGRGRPPLADGPDAQAAWQRCAAPAAAYLGGDWHDGMLVLSLVLPRSGAWTAGARWFRCDVAVVVKPWEVVDHQRRQGSLRGALAAGDQRLGCIEWTADGEDYHVVPCTAPHRKEYVGFVSAPLGPFLDPAVPDDPKTGRNPASAWAESQCWPKIEALVGTRNVSLKIGWSYGGFFEDRWGYGDRSTRCFAGPLADVEWTGSIKGLGSRDPKV